MTYQRFEDLPVWQKAAELYEQTEESLENHGFKATSDFRDQLDRVALSVSNNIAEGCERDTTNELLQFIYIARLDWRGAFDADFETPPGEQSQRAGGFEIRGGKLFATIARLGGFASEFILTCNQKATKARWGRYASSN